MAISASTKNADNIVRSIAPKSMFEDGAAVNSAAVSFNQGDMICLDTSTHLLKRVAALTDAATFVGIARQAVTAGVLNGPYDGLATAGALSSFSGPVYGVVANMVLKTGDAFNAGSKIYLADGSDSQTVSSTDSGDHDFIGIYQGPTVASAAAGQVGPCLIGCRYPSATGSQDINF